MRRFLLVIIAAIALVAGAEPSDTVAQALRPARRVVELTAGGATVLDSYLSPVRYRGWTTGLRYEHLQATGFAPQRWIRQLTVGAGYALVHNPARSGNKMHVLDLAASWTLMRRWRLRPAWQLALGPMIDADGGAVYNPSGSNNVVSARARVSLGGAVRASFATRLAGRPLLLTAHFALPVIGIWFCPDGYESYYEIYLGNRRGLVHPAWWGNRFDANITVGADWQLGGTILRLAYHGHFETAACRGLDTRHVRHTVGIGLGGDFVSLSPRHRLSDAATIITAH